MSVEELDTLYKEKMKEKPKVAKTEEPTLSDLTDTSSEKITESEPKVTDSKSDTEGETSVDPAIQSLVDGMKKEMKGVQKQLARTQTELGQYRKMETLRQEEQRKLQSQQEPIDYYDDPDGRTKQIIQEELGKTDSKVLEQQNAIDSNRDLTLSYVPEFEDYVDDIGNQLKDMLPDDPDNMVQIEAFKSNPYTWAPITLLFGAEAAKLRKRIVELEGRVTSSNNGKGDLINKIKNLGSQQSTVFGGAGQSASDGTLSLSDAQIEQMGNDNPDKLADLYSQLTSKR